MRSESSDFAPIHNKGIREFTQNIYQLLSKEKPFSSIKHSTQTMVIDLFYKTYEGDYQFLEHSLRSAKQHAQGFRKIILVTDFGHKEALIKLVKRVGIKSVEIFELDQRLDIHPHRKLPPKIRKLKKSWFKLIKSRTRVIKHIGYEVQKAAKCDWPRWTDADAVFQIDSDMILTDTLAVDDLFVGKHPVWQRQPWASTSKNHIKFWRHGSLWFYELNDSHYSYMRSPGFLITRELACKFSGYIQATYACSPYRLFSNPKFPEFSEYELLGLYAERHNLELDYIFKEHNPSQSCKLPIRQFWSWGGITPEVHAELECIQGNED